jgi:hypothetical protein
MAENAIESTPGKFHPSIDHPHDERPGNEEEKEEEDGDGPPFLVLFCFSRASFVVVCRLDIAERNGHVGGRAGRELL